VAIKWKTPVYKLSRWGKRVEIDVTTSISPGLSPHQIVKNEFIPFLQRKGNVQKILDFGAGALRHTFPLLKAGFEVCAVEFEEAFTRPTGKKALAKARRNPNFTTLIWPRDFLSSSRKFDAAILAFVMQTMPVPRERMAVISAINKKLTSDGYLLYMSRYGQISTDMNKNKISDGYFMWPSRTVHSFYREFSTEETHEIMKAKKFMKLRYWSARGTEQVFLYGKGKSTWI